MNGVIIYALKASAATAILYLVFLLFYHKDTFHFRNRWYLVLTLVLPWILPAFRISLRAGRQINVPAILAAPEAFMAGHGILPGVREIHVIPDVNSLIVMIYLSVAAFFILRTAIALFGTFRIIRNGSIVDSGFPKIVVTDREHAAFSFFPYVVLSRETYEEGGLEHLLEHEKTHVRQFHTLDLMLCEMAKALQWFNPFVYFIKRSIVLNHEYIADQSLIRDADRQKEYQYKLLGFHTKATAIPLVHCFSSLIKNRLIMINTKPTPKIARWKNLILLPVLSVLMFVLACESTALQTDRQKPALSDDSQLSIRRFIQENVMYPGEARSSLDTGVVYVVVRMDKGGVIEECRSHTDINDVDAPMLGEVVITGYRPPQDQVIEKNTSEHAALITECERVAYLMEDLDIPEWEENSLSFTLVFHFRMV